MPSIPASNSSCGIFSSLTKSVYSDNVSLSQYKGYLFLLSNSNFLPYWFLFGFFTGCLLFLLLGMDLPWVWSSSSLVIFMCISTKPSEYLVYLRLVLGKYNHVFFFHIFCCCWVIIILHILSKNFCIVFLEVHTIPCNSFPWKLPHWNFILIRHCAQPCYHKVYPVNDDIGW